MSAQVQAEVKPNQWRAVGTLPVLPLMAATNSATWGTPGCFQYHSKTQVPMRASGGRAFEHLELLLRAGDMEALVEAELHSLLQRVDRILRRR